MVTKKVFLNSNCNVVRDGRRGAQLEPSQVLEGTYTPIRDSTRDLADGVEMQDTHAGCTSIANRRHAKTSAVYIIYFNGIQPSVRFAWVRSAPPD